MKNIGQRIGQGPSPNRPFMVTVNHTKLDLIWLVLTERLIEDRRVKCYVVFIMVTSIDIQRHDDVLGLIRLNVLGIVETLP